MSGKLLILVSDIDEGDIDRIKRICLSMEYSSIIVIGDRGSIRRIGLAIGRYRDKCNLQLIVFNYEKPEENSLLLFTRHKPDILIDMDKSNRLIHLKKLFEKTSITRLK